MKLDKERMDVVYFLVGTNFVMAKRCLDDAVADAAKIGQLPRAKEWKEFRKRRKLETLLGENDDDSDWSEADFGPGLVEGTSVHPRRYSQGVQLSAQDEGGEVDG